VRPEGGGTDAVRDDSAIRIGFLSFTVDTLRRERTRGNGHVVLEILRSQPDLDLLIGAGWTVFDADELEAIRAGNPNPRTVVMLETWQDSSGGYAHTGHVVRGHDVVVENVPQIFATSADANRDPRLVAELLKQIEDVRRFEVCGRTVTWLICGEINVLANLQLEGNRCRFRFEGDDALSACWERILAGTDIFVNPTHTVMGNQGKLSKRRGYLSSNDRVFCSVSNVDATGARAADASERLGHVPVQYCLHDGSLCAPEYEERSKDHIFRRFLIRT
jgi:hypothetical protein